MSGRVLALQGCPPAEKVVRRAPRYNLFIHVRMTGNARTIMSKLRVLVVGEGFIAEGVEVRTAEESSVLEAIQEFDPQVVVMDVRLADMLPAVRAESGQNVVLVALGEEQGRHNGWDSGFHLFFTSLADAGFRQELRNLKRSADLAGYRRRERLHLRFRRELRPAG